MRINGYILLCVALPLLGCHLTPEQRFVRSERLRNPSDRYELFRTSVDVLRYESYNEISYATDAYEATRTRFHDLPEVVEFANRKLKGWEKVSGIESNYFNQIERRMSKGDTLYLYNLDGKNGPEFGKLILDSRGSEVWREIEGGFRARKLQPIN